MAKETENQTDAEELSEQDLDEVQGGNWANKAKKAAKKHSKKIHDAQKAIVGNL